MTRPEARPRSEPLGRRLPVVGLPDALDAALRAHADREGISLAEAVRRALAAYLQLAAPAPEGATSEP